MQLGGLLTFDITHSGLIEQCHHQEGQVILA